MHGFKATAGSGVTPAQIESFQAAAWQAHGESIRNDSARKSPGYIQTTRAAIRHFVNELCFTKSRLDSRGEISQARKNEIMEAYASGLGLKTENGRMDSYFFPGDLIDRSGEIARLSNFTHALSDRLPVRSFNPWMQLVQTRGVQRTGSATLWKPGVDTVNHSDFYAGGVNRQVHHFVTKTTIAWDYILYGSLSDISIVEEQSRAAIETLKDALEDVHANGFQDTDLVGVSGLQIPQFVSSTNYAAPATTIEDIFEEFMGAILSFQSAAQFRGGRGNTLFIGGNLYNAILPKNNFSAGGAVSGSQLFGGVNLLSGVAAANAALGEMWKQLGIEYVYQTPSLDNFGGDSTKSAALLANTPSGPNGIRQLLGMAPAPVRTAATLTGDETLFAVTTAGLEAPTTERAGLFIGLVG